MSKRSLIVFAGSNKSRALVDSLKPNGCFWLDDIPTKKKYVERLSSIDHVSTDIICVNWPYITPDFLLEYGNMYTIHESLLPSFAGCAPVNWSIIEGSSLFGVTLFRQSKIVDAGEILFQDGVYCPGMGATAVFKNMEACYKRCATFIQKNILRDCQVLSGFGKRTYYPKRRPTDNIVEFGFEPDKLINLFLSTTVDYPLIFKRVETRFEIHGIRVFGEFVDYFPLGRVLPEMTELSFYNNSFVLYGIEI